MNQQNFLDFLNPEQRAAVDQVYGTVLVIAGPGTGKTQMLTTRIANLLKQGIGIEPNNILCLTFTENGAVEMRNRLQKWIGNEAYKVKICTFHGFCESTVRDYPEYFLEQQKGEIASDLDKAMLYREIIDSKKWQYLRPFGDNYCYQRDFLMQLSQLKREDVSIEDYRKLIPQERERMLADENNYYKRDSKYGKKGEIKKGVEEKIATRTGKMTEFTELWEAFEAAMKARNLYDFDDQILNFLKTIKTNDALKSDLQEKYQFILVDEYQDTNNAQNEILWELTDYDENPNLFAVGDDDQSIYRFQGANVANILDFQTRFPRTTRVNLSRNYRCAPEICEAALQSIAHNAERIDHEKQIIPSGENAKVKGEIQKAVLSSRLAEIAFLVEKINDAQKSGIPLSDMAILVRTNAEVKELATYLPRFGVRSSARIRDNIFEDSNVKMLMLMMEVFLNPTKNGEWFELLHAPFWDIPRKELAEISVEYNQWKYEYNRRDAINRVSTCFFQMFLDRFYEETNTNVETLHATSLQNNNENEPPNLFDVLGQSEPDVRTYGDTPLQQNIRFPHIQKTIDLFLRLKKEFYNVAPEILMHKFFHDSGMAKAISNKYQATVQADIMKIQKFIEFIVQENRRIDAKKELVEERLDAIINRIHLHQELDIALYPDSLPADKNAVQILTAHGAKGSQFEVVFIPGLADKNWGHRWKVEKLPVPDLFKSDHDEIEDERRLFFVALTRAKQKIFMSYAEKDFQGREKNPSLFWNEIPDELCKIQENDEVEQKSLELATVFFTAESPQFTRDEREVLRELAENFVWSATSLQNYLDCPRRFLYENLLKFPTVRSPQNKFLNFGSAAHSALEMFFRKYAKTKSLPPKAFLLTEFHHALQNQNLTASEFDESLSHGEEILTNYYEKKKDEFSPDVLTELNLRGKNIQVDGIRITGKIDKVEFLDNHKSKAIVVDYKTGKPKSKIERGSKNTEYLWRQMVFYDLLMQNARLNFHVDHYALEFLSPDYNGNLKRKSLEVAAEDREWVLNELKETNEKVLNLEFPLVENYEGNAEIDYWQQFGQ